MKSSSDLLEELVFRCSDLSRGPFGSWINGLFSTVTPPYDPQYPILRFDEQKELFFQLLERLLSEGRVVLIPPLDISRYSDGRRRESIKRRVQDGDDRIWDEDPRIMVEYMRKTFPADAVHEDDLVLNDYWYSTACPQIGWVHPETGELVFS